MDFNKYLIPLSWGQPRLTLFGGRWSVVGGRGSGVGG